MPTPEQKARLKIDELLTAAGWEVRDRKDLNLYAGKSGVYSVATREFPTESGPADYVLFVW